MEIAPDKPADGEPCNGCGLCCAAELCQAGEMAFGDVPAPCPGMSFREGRFWCKLVETERAAGMEPIIENSLGIGAGCFATAEEPLPF